MITKETKMGIAITSIATGACIANLIWFVTILIDSMWVEIGIDFNAIIALSLCIGLVSGLLVRIKFLAISKKPSV